MAERSYSVESIRKGDRPNTLNLTLRDQEFEYTFEIVLPSGAVTKMEIFPGSNVKITLEKTD